MYVVCIPDCGSKVQCAQVLMQGILYNWHSSWNHYHKSNPITEMASAATLKKKFKPTDITAHTYDQCPLILDGKNGIRYQIWW